MTDATPFAPAPTAEKHADDLQPVIDAVLVVVPDEQEEGAKAFFKRYLKGWIALVGVGATYSLLYIPIDSLGAQIAGALVGVTTVVGLVAARNGV